MPSPYQEEHDSYLAHYLPTGEKKHHRHRPRSCRACGATAPPFPWTCPWPRRGLGPTECSWESSAISSERSRPRKAGSELAAIVESSDDAIIGKTLDGTITSWNAGAERLYGYSAVGNQRAADHFCSLRRTDPDELTAFCGGIKRGESVDHYETVARQERRPANRCFAHGFSDQGRRRPDRRCFGNRSRHTAQKRMNEEMRAMTQQLWHAAKLASVGELAASIAHELNNPLGTVTLRLESVLAALLPMIRGESRWKSLPRRRGGWPSWWPTCCNFHAR